MHIHIYKNIKIKTMTQWDTNYIIVYLTYRRSYNKIGHRTYSSCSKNSGDQNMASLAVSPAAALGEIK